MCIIHVVHVVHVEYVAHARHTTLMTSGNLDLLSVRSAKVSNNAPCRMESVQQPTTMPADSPPPPIATAVHTARAELSAVIRALTQVLDAVAEGDLPAEPPDVIESDAVRVEREAALHRRSLTPVLERFEKLHKAVEQATTLYGARVDEMKKEEEAVGEEERAALVERRSLLIEEVHAKNHRIKVLIDHLRELHRDIVVMAGCMKPFPPPIRKA